MTRCPAPQSVPKRKLGSVFQRKQDGRWAAAVTLSDGRRVTRYLKPDTPNPEKAAHELLAKLITEAAAGEDITPSRMTLADWLDRHLQRTSRGRAQATIRDRMYLARKITGKLGKVMLPSLTPARYKAGWTG
ncbi:hypothetical protein [Deinococcus psychrotolerans]|uniref:hypothetical protein n=1 Tax=Deinococcus psychrotolerans TaxID=2489213 RepID=UPI0013DE2AF5|nr:hypothetical protein [Deinococcus psychrotolerans]